MKTIIIEDESKSANELKKILKAAAPHIEVVMMLDSIASSLAWLRANPSPDFIFMDIQLGDGLSFKIFNEHKIECPVIFCTAYDKYALEAFKANGVGYLLKPVREEDLKDCLNKIDTLRNHFVMNGNTMLELVNSIRKSNPSYKSSYLINFKAKMLPISVQDVVYFCIQEGQCKLRTKDNANYSIPKNLEELENELDPKLFFRANRQFLIGYSYIKEVEHYMNRKLEVHLALDKTEPVIISKEKSTEFLSWMDNR